MAYTWIVELTSTSLFVLGGLTGFVVGPLFALSFAWIKHQLNVIPLLLGISLCACGLGSIGMQKIAGKYFFEMIIDDFNRIVSRLYNGS